MFQRVGINRVSLGLQSAQSKELKALGRIHTYQDLLDSVALLQEYGISNINIDLMEDIPYQTLESYKDTLEKVCTLPITHISSYSLIIEPGTPFYEMEQKGELLIANEDEDRKMYELTKEILKEHGYERYEISNYAKKGMEKIFENGSAKGISDALYEIAWNERERKAKPEIYQKKYFQALNLSILFQEREFIIFLKEREKKYCK